MTKPRSMADAMSEFLDTHPEYDSIQPSDKVVQEIDGIDKTNKYNQYLLMLDEIDYSNRRHQEFEKKLSDNARDDLSLIKSLVEEPPFKCYILDWSVWNSLSLYIEDSLPMDWFRFMTIGIVLTHGTYDKLFNRYHFDLLTLERHHLIQYPQDLDPRIVILRKCGAWPF